MATLALSNLTKAWSGKTTVHGIDLEIPDGAFVALVGPSGCGKSTTLRMIAGLEEVTAGEIRIGDRVVTHDEPRDRGVSMVFQNYALFPHMTVRDNIGFGLKMRGVAKDEIRRKVEAAAETLELTALLDRRPNALSGGQRQRVAMGRAIVREPKAFLFDEPLSNLDAQLRGQMRAELKKLHQSIGTTTLYVTHDQVEAMTLADTVVVMRDGRIEQAAPPAEIYRNPATKFVAGFVGTPRMNFSEAEIVDGPALRLDRGPVLPLPPALAARPGMTPGRRVTMGLRPEHVGAAVPGTPDGPGIVEARVELVETLGAETLVHVRLGTAPICAKLGPFAAAKEGETVRLELETSEIRLFDTETERAL
ncbi:ABC transporter ATP-binding protein [Chachezhania sediminis]|uniref:ABC transporter ATP-binding protein n=1 Tax=Chachezhania sediminis TaxID=2599291 RepID=UPI00131E69E0|nr:sn-glycerol-3-phosphate ABC transporter ATP-binding protein UgpC [Chachezhania sediminis]